MLVEREWLAFGHKFADRNLTPGPSHWKASARRDSSSSSASEPLFPADYVNGFATPGNVLLPDGEVSPIFIQWLDCVHQVQSQFTAAFEFNGLFLVCHSNYYHVRFRFHIHCTSYTVPLYSVQLYNTCKCLLRLSSYSSRALLITVAQLTLHTLYEYVQYCN